MKKMLLVFHFLTSQTMNLIHSYWNFATTYTNFPHDIDWKISQVPTNY